MGLKSVAGKLVGLSLLIAALLRVDFASCFGKGTGMNKINVSALSVTTHFAFKNLDKLPNQIQPYAQKFFVALAIPREAASDYGILPPVKTKKTKKKKKVHSLEGRALEWCKSMKNDRSMAKLLEDNTFVIFGAMISFFSMIASFFIPYEGFQNLLVGLGTFWFGANGAHGGSVQFTWEFIGISVLVLFSLLFLAEGPPPKQKQKQKKSKQKDDEDDDFQEEEEEDDDDGKKKKKKECDEWDDGIGGVTMDEVRKRGKKGGCC